MTNWYALIGREMSNNNESWSDIVESTLTDVELHQLFNDGFGTEEGVPFTVWTNGYIYFPTCYDGSEGVASISRNPNGIPTYHIGG